MIDPCPAARMCGIAARHSHIGAVTLTRSVDSHAAVDMSATVRVPAVDDAGDGVVDEHREAPDRLDGVGDEPRARVLGAEVGGDEGGVATAAGDLLDDRRAPRRIPPVHHDARALGAELDRDRPSDARGRSGHEGELAVQPHAAGRVRGPRSRRCRAGVGRLPLMHPGARGRSVARPGLLLMWWNAPDGADVKRRARGRARLLALGAGLALLAATVPAGAAPIDDARTKVTETQHAADAAAVRYDEAIGRLEQLGHEIEDLLARIEAGRAEAARLRALARRRAVEAYVGRDGLHDAGFVLDGGDPLDQIRRDKLLARTKEREDDAVEALAAVERDLARQRTDLEARRAEQETTVEQVEAEQATLQTQLARRRDRARAARGAAAARAGGAAGARDRGRDRREASNRSNGKDYSGAVVSTGIVCPIRGALSFTDSWGAPRHQGRHQGVDLMAARGTPNVAVVSGRVEFREGGLSGLGAYLHGDDGHLYYYFHLSAYEGGARQVAQGDVIGYVGNTGDARYTATHTHFEFHPGGGAAVNPYPSVAAVC